MTKYVSTDKRFLELRRLLSELEQEYNLSSEQLLFISKEITIPLSLFSSGLSSFELIVKYLRENKHLDPKSIAKLTGRSKQSIWQAYHNAKKKFPKKFLEEQSTYNFPLKFISNKQYSVLEHIVRYLKDVHNLSYASIARILHRDQRTIWTVYNRTKKK